jgi:hypothetical protein
MQQTSKFEIPEPIQSEWKSPDRSVPPWFLSQHFQRFKQWRGVLAAADGDPDRLEHLSRFHAEFLSGGAQRLIERDRA